MIENILLKIYFFFGRVRNEKPKENTRPIAQYTRAISSSLLIIALTYVGAIVVLLFTDIVAPNSKSDITIPVIAGILSMLGCYYLASQTYMDITNKRHNFFEQWRLHHFAIAVLVGGATLLLNIALTKALPGAHMDGPNITQELATQKGNIFLFIYPIVIGPILEEYLFRGGVFLWFKMYIKKQGWLFKIAYCLTSGILFCIPHLSVGMNIQYAILVIGITFISGVTYAALFLKTRNIGVPILAHIVYNIIITCLM